MRKTYAFRPPRTLKEPVFCRFSFLRKMRAPDISENELCVWFRVHGRVGVGACGRAGGWVYVLICGVMVRFQYSFLRKRRAPDISENELCARFRVHGCVGVGECGRVGGCMC